MSRKRLADKLGQIRLDWAVSQNEVQTTDKAKISALGYLSARWPWNKKPKKRFKGSRSSYLRFLGFVWGFGGVVNRRGLKRQNLRFRVMRNLHNFLVVIFGWIFRYTKKRAEKPFKTLEEGFLLILILVGDNSHAVFEVSTPLKPAWLSPFWAKKKTLYGIKLSWYNLSVLSLNYRKNICKGFLYSLL